MLARATITIIGVFLVSYIGAFFCRRLALRFNIIDIPGRRKIHHEPVPLLGGLSIFIGIAAGFIANAAQLKPIMPIFIGGASIFTINLIDDVKKLSARFRLLAELIIALFVALAGIKISFLPAGFIGDIAEIIITVIWLTGLTNAFNYLDGMDGLATGSAVINAFFFAFIAASPKQPALVFFCLIIVSGCLGFLPHNIRREKTFLGDAGSTLLGFVIGCIALMGNWAEDNIVKISIPVLILGVPVFDMIFTTVVRIKDKKVQTFAEWLKYSGKDHFHHSLVYIGASPALAVIFIWAITISLGLSAVMVSNDTAWEGVMTLLQASIIFMVIGMLIVIGKHHKSGWQKTRHLP